MDSYDDEGLTPQFWIGIILCLGVIALIVWGLMNPDDVEEVRSTAPCCVTRQQDILEDYDDDIY